MKNKSLFHHSSKLLLGLSMTWAVVLLMIGGWWAYVMINFEHFLKRSDRPRIMTMIIWEGGSFLVLLMLLSVSLFLLYLKDQKKTKSLQAFFASLTHELKTPLASIRLQSEVIHEVLSAKNDQTITTLINRLVEDTSKLETQMDKILQLSRLERGGDLSLSNIKIIPLIKRLVPQDVSTEITSDILDPSLIGDEFALELVFKNLFENTINHSTHKKVNIHLKKISPDLVQIQYDDHGKFYGDTQKLGTLFYKHDSKKGSGIGLYLSHQLIEKMNGTFIIKKSSDSNLKFILEMKLSEDSHA